LVDEVKVKNVLLANRPDGSNSIRVDLTFKHPVKLNKTPKELNIPIIPGMPPKEPEENKAILFLSLAEWEELKEKYQVGNKIKVFIDKKKRLIFE